MKMYERLGITWKALRLTVWGRYAMLGDAFCEAKHRRARGLQYANRKHHCESEHGVCVYRINAATPCLVSKLPRYEPMGCAQVRT
eukprot:scaffold25694_cov127-Cylindrotheca_fusiformis.AAC.6